MPRKKINLSVFFERLLNLQCKMSNAELCRIINVSPPLYQKWKNGSTPGYDKLQLISRRLKCTHDWLTGQEVPENSMMYKTRTILKISYTEIAESLGITEEDVRDMESGKKVTTPQIEAKINELLNRQYYGCEPSHLMLREDSGFHYGGIPKSENPSCAACAKKDKVITQLTETVSSLTRQLEGARKANK